MDAVEFLKAKYRLCNNYTCDNCCPMIDSCDDETDDGYARQVRTVEQWAKEHPIKTRQSEFLKQWPNVKIGDDGLPIIAPCQLDAGVAVPIAFGVCHKDCGCRECHRDFWLKEIEED